MVPDWVVVIVAVDIVVPASTVVVAPDPPVADEPPVVTVVVTCVARLLASFSAFLNAEAGMGTPTRSQASCKGVSRRLLSRALSQFPCIHRIRSGRKFPAEARQRHWMSVTSQLSSWDWSIQLWTHCGREETN